MPVCEGLPSGPCPHQRNDKTVTIGKGDLLLCQFCDTERRRLFDENKKLTEANKLIATKPAAEETATANSRKTKSTRNASAKSGSVPIPTTVQPGDATVSDLSAATGPHADMLTPSAAEIITLCDGAIGKSTSNPDHYPAGLPLNRRDAKVVINELLTYATFYRDKSSCADLHRTIISFYLPSEINESKNVLLNEFSSQLTDSQFNTVRRQSSTRSAQDAEAEDILGILELVDNLNILNKICFTAVTLDRLPHYGPNEVNICAIADKQSRLDNQFDSLSKKLDETLVQNRVDINALADMKFNALVAKLEEYSNNFSSKCEMAVGLVKSHLAPERPNADNHVDRTMNVVLTGIDENRDASIWRDIVVRSLNYAAGRQVEVVDAFRLGRFSNGKKRPILVKLTSAWNRRLVIAGAHKLRDTTDLSRVFISADEPLEVRRRNTLQRLQRRAEREGKAVLVSDDGVLSIDGVNTFCLRRGFIAVQPRVGLTPDG